MMFYFIIGFISIQVVPQKDRKVNHAYFSRIYFLSFWGGDFTYIYIYITYTYENILNDLCICLFENGEFSPSNCNLERGHMGTI